MKKVVRNVLASAISVALLAGCSDDKKDDPVNPPIHGEEGITGEKGPGGPVEGDNGGIGDEGQTCLQAGTCVEGDEDNNNGNEGTAGAYQELYGQNAHTGFMAQILDSTGGSAELDADGAAELNNISVTPIERIEPTSDPVLFSNIAVSEESATFQLISYTGSGEDLSKLSSNATLQFDLKVNDKVGDDGNVTLLLADESSAEYSMNLTSAINAFGGASTQRVKVPFGCFDGMDFSQSVIPFAFNSTDVDFDLGSVRIVPNSLDQEYVLVCDSDSEVLTELPAIAFKRYFSEEEDQEFTGFIQSARPVHDHNLGNGTPGQPHNRAAVVVPSNNTLPNSGDVGVIFQRNSDEATKKDINNFVESAILTFEYTVRDALPEGRKLVLWFSTVDSNDDSFRIPSNSTTPIVLDVNFNFDLSVQEAEWKTAKIAVKDIVTDKNGTVNVNLVRNLDSIVVETISEGSSSGIKASQFLINDIKFATNEEK